MLMIPKDHGMPIKIDIPAQRNFLPPPLGTASVTVAYNVK